MFTRSRIRELAEVEQLVRNQLMMMLMMMMRKR